ILSSGAFLRVPLSFATLIESATRAIEPVGSMSRLTGGPITEFLSGRLATIFGLSGSARSTISTESLPAGDRTTLPASSQISFSSLPTIIKGAACAASAPPASIAAAQQRFVMARDIMIVSPSFPAGLARRFFETANYTGRCRTRHHGVSDQTRAIERGRKAGGQSGKHRPAFRPDLALERHVAAVDQQVGGGDEGRFVAGEINRAGGGLLRLAGPVEQVARSVDDARPLLAADACARPLGQDEAGRDGVGADVIGGVIHRQDAGEVNERRFGGAIGRAQRHAQMAELRGDVDDAAAA